MVRDKIIKTLNAQKGEEIPTSELALQVELSHPQLKEEIQNLQEKGYIIKETSQGYRLLKSPQRLLPYEIQRELTTQYMGHEIHYYQEVDSTNEVAKSLAESDAPEGTLVIAESQRRGKGRRGKRWVSPEGGVWMTMILHPPVKPSKAPQLTLVTGVAAAKTLKTELGLNVGIKWPNDILIGEKKVCGILTEASSDSGQLDYVVVGIGIDLNVDLEMFPPELRAGATSLKTELHRDIYGVDLVQSFLQNFEETYEKFKNNQFPEILNQWRDMSATIGKKVEVHKKGRIVHGEAVGINHEGVLILELPDGTLRKVISGECLHLPPQ